MALLQTSGIAPGNQRSTAEQIYQEVQTAPMHQSGSPPTPRLVVQEPHRCALSLLQVEPVQPGQGPNVFGLRGRSGLCA